MNGPVRDVRATIAAAGEEPSKSAFYPALVCAVASLLGGPLAAPMLATVNAYSLRRLRRERIWLSCGASVAFTAPVLVAWAAAHTAPREMPALRSALYVAGPALNLFLWAALFWHQRASSRPAGVRSVNAARLWSTCLLVVVFAHLAQLAITLLANRLFA